MTEDPPRVGDPPLSPAEQAIVCFVVAQVRQAYADGARQFTFTRPDRTTAAVTFGANTEADSHVIED